ncbi:MAG: RluA family pseudouridine synthase [Spirochaetes bacterium]|nr:RluA family pseudouridine synthase [Spirochaetota bacterium]
MGQDPEIRFFTVGKNDQGKRIDRILRNLLPQYSLGSIYRMIRKGLITLNQREVSPAQRVSQGDVLSIPSSVWPKALTLSEPISIFPLPILYEDEDFLVLNKPKGMTVHGEHSLLKPVLQYLHGKIPASLTYSPGPLHRLDRNTTGILVFGKSLEGARVFSSALQTGLVQKYYVSILTGILREPVRWEHSLIRDTRHRKTLLGTESTGEYKRGITEVFPLAQSTRFPSGLTLAILRIVTGKTHQIRAQASFEHHPLLGDTKYGGQRFRGEYLLHAYRLVLPGRLDIRAPLPKRFSAALKTLFGVEPISFEGIPL